MMIVPTTPTAAASVGVAMPARIGPSVTTVRTTWGNIPSVSSTASVRNEAARASGGSGGPSRGLIRQRMSVQAMKIPASRKPGPNDAA
jgi:hypothetical protein